LGLALPCRFFALFGFCSSDRNLCDGLRLAAYPSAVLLNTRKAKLEHNHSQCGAILVGMFFLLRTRLRSRGSILEGARGTGCAVHATHSFVTLN
jgi:hypothetical protein